jgi:hypothetical protein
MNSYPSILLDSEATKRVKGRMNKREGINYIFRFIKGTRIQVGIRGIPPSPSHL